MIGGVCLKCGGSGKQAKRPSGNGHRYAVFFLNQETGKTDRIWTFRARSAAEARRCADTRHYGASDMFKDVYALESAVIVRADELDETDDK